MSHNKLKLAIPLWVKLQYLCYHNTFVSRITHNTLCHNTFVHNTLYRYTAALLAWLNTLRPKTMRSSSQSLAWPVFLFDKLPFHLSLKPLGKKVNVIFSLCWDSLYNYERVIFGMFLNYALDLSPWTFLVFNNLEFPSLSILDI